MEKTELITLTADIVAAHVTHNSVALGELPKLVSEVYGALASLRAPSEAAVADAKPEPAVSVRASIKPSHIVCLVCGAKQKTLKRHLNTAHNLTPGEYRERYELRPDYPMVSPDYAQTRRDMAIRIGLGKKRAPQRKATRRKIS